MAATIVINFAGIRKKGRGGTTDDVVRFLWRQDWEAEQW